MDHTSSMEEGFRARLLELLSSEKELQAMLDGLPTEAVATLSATTLRLESIFNLPGSCVFGRL